LLVEEEDRDVIHSGREAKFKATQLGGLETGEGTMVSSMFMVHSLNSHPFLPIASAPITKDGKNSSNGVEIKLCSYTQSEIVDSWVLKSLCLLLVTNSS
jgi:hypothetical protein